PGRVRPRRAHRRPDRAAPGARVVARAPLVTARRAVVRWAMRLFRREWRQQLLLLGLLTVAVAGAIFAATAAYTTVPNEDGAFGSARTELVVNRPGPQLGADVASVARQLGPVEVITDRFAAVPGSVDTLDVRAQQ